jgi:hypothetical protein
MALKPDREVYITDIKFTCDVAAEAGSLLVYKTSQGSGHAVGAGVNETAPQATLPGTGTPASGTRVAGALLHDVENIYEYALLADGTPASGLGAGIGDPVNISTHRNWHKTTQVVGENVNLLKDGAFWTDRVVGAPAAGDPAYLGASGKFSATQSNSIPAVGKFETAKDADGFAYVVVKLA